MWWPDVENKSGTNHRKNNVSFFFAQCFLQSEFTVSRFLRRKRMEHGIRVCGVAYLRRHIWLLDARGKYVMVGCCFGCVSRFLAISAIYSELVIYSYCELFTKKCSCVSIPRFQFIFRSLDEMMKKKTRSPLLSLCYDEYYSINDWKSTFFLFYLYKWKIYV